MATIGYQEVDGGLGDRTIEVFLLPFDLDRRLIQQPAYAYWRLARAKLLLLLRGMFQRPPESAFAVFPCLIYDNNSLF